MQKDKIAKQGSAADDDGCALFPVQCISSSAEFNAKGYKTMHCNGLVLLLLMMMIMVVPSSPFNVPHKQCRY